MESVINVENFYFAYKKSDLVLRDINFEIKKGSFTVITGPSGAGKTTLCKAMTGIVPYYMGGRYSGDVKINGESTKASASAILPCVWALLWKTTKASWFH